MSIYTYLLELEDQCVFEASEFNDSSDISTTITHSGFYWPNQLPCLEEVNGVPLVVGVEVVALVIEEDEEVAVVGAPMMQAAGVVLAEEEEGAGEGLKVVDVVAVVEEAEEAEEVQPLKSSRMLPPHLILYSELGGN